MTFHPADRPALCLDRPNLYGAAGPATTAVAA